MGAQLNFVAKHGMMKRFLMLRKKLGWPCIAAFVSERDIYGYLDADNVVLNHQQVWESSVSAFKSTTASRFTFLQNEPNHQRIWGLCSQLLSLGQTSSHAVFPRDLLRAPPGPCRLARPLRRLGIHGIRRSEATESLHGATDEPRGSAGPNGGWDEDGWGFLFGTSLFFWCWERHHYHSFVTRMVDAVFYSEAINELYCNSMWFHPFWSRLLRIRYVSSARARDNYWHHQRPQNMCEETWEKIRHVYSSVWSAAGQSRKRRQCW